ncbi:MAG: hypothetical protein JKY34_16000 [Kordiimonadaceae bacterium]|nr:hypothetical protein [Kordiimonadaceae bacterium]
MTEKNNGPVDTLRDGALKATIWKREGEKRDYFTTSFAKTYQDKEGNLKDGHSFGSNDLLGVAELARLAHQRSMELKREEFINARRDDLSGTPERTQEVHTPVQTPVQSQAPSPVQQPAPAPQAPEPQPVQAPAMPDIPPRG